MRQIIEKNIKDLIPYCNNSRTHSDEQVQQIASSIKEFGFTNPVLIDEQGGIIAGHGRVMAAKKLGLAEVPCIVLDGLSEAQKKAYIIADNKLALNSGWDADMLKVEMERLGELGFDLSLTGFDDIELGELFGDDEEPDETESSDDFESAYREQYAVIVTCRDAVEQEQIFNKLQSSGYEVKVVCT